MKKPGLFALDPNVFIRDALNSERFASYQASKHDNGAGIIIVDGKKCYVETSEDDEDFIKLFKMGYLPID